MRYDGVAVQVAVGPANHALVILGRQIVRVARLPRAARGEAQLDRGRVVGDQI